MLFKEFLSVKFFNTFFYAKNKTEEGDEKIESLYEVLTHFGVCDRKIIN